MCAAVGYGNLAVARGVPILQAHAMALIRLSGGSEFPRFEVDRGLAIRSKIEVGLEGDALRTLGPALIADATRESFSRTWGVSVEDQHVIESSLDDWVVDLSSVTTYGLEWTSDWVSAVDLENDLPTLL
jgi:hypothetical protein